MFSMRHAVMIIATGGYVGRFPIAPGTVGSLLGIPLAFWLSHYSGPMALIATILLSLVAVWAAQEAEKLLEAKDPRCVVVDEIAGMVVTMLFLPFTLGTATAGFFLFRIFDIIKPPPARQLDRHLKGGWGIVLDDIAAGIMANMVLQIGIYCINR